MTAARARLIVFGAALVLRIVAGALFFGSVDVVNSALNSVALFDGKRLDLPYFPTINAFIWFGGVLAAKLPIVLPLALKLVPILFDSLVAVLLYDLVALTAPSKALLSGLLYAVSPLALLITSIHGQWDSVALFFLLLAFAVRESSRHVRLREPMFGILFAISVLAKPIALPFILLFPRRERDTQAPRAWQALGGFAATICAAFAIYHFYGYSGPAAFFRIGSYAAEGVQVFGFPFAPLVAGLSLQKIRILMVVPEIVAVAIFYHQRRLVALDAVMMFYLLSLATTGISPQYLLWPLPFLLATQRLRLASVYTALTAPFLLLYYASPWTSFLPFENSAVFVPLRGAAWLLPPAFLASRALLPAVHAIGNVAIPALAWFAAIEVYKKPAARAAQAAKVSLGAWYAAPTLLLALTILITKISLNAAQVRAHLHDVWNAIPTRYAMHVSAVDPAILFTADSNVTGLANVTVLMAILTAAWCAAAFYSGGRRKCASPNEPHTMTTTYEHTCETRL